METEKSFSGEEAEKDFCGRLFFLAAIFPFSNEKACLGVTAKTDFFDRLYPRTLVLGYFYYRRLASFISIFSNSDIILLSEARTMFLPYIFVYASILRLASAE